DGIWATAPYFHNGSVPTVAAVLDPDLRPTYWTRNHQAATYAPAALGFEHVALEHGKEGASSDAERKRIYDTTRPGYGNGGHRYAAELSGADRAALLEYLKTL